MSTKSRIEWTSSTWNPVTGCDKVSEGCDNCYAERMARRLQGMGVEKYRQGFKVRIHPAVLEAPLHLKKPQIIFVNSMSDVFHPDVPFDFVRKMFDVMVRCRQHVFQVLTKRSKHLVRLQHRLPWPDNIWMGVTVEKNHYKYRIDDLRKTNANIKFLSLEPLLGPLGKLDLSGIDWVVVGGESGPGARPMLDSWVDEIHENCRRSDTAFFFKQWGGIHKKRRGRLLHGRTWDEMPISADDYQQTLQL